MKRLSDWDRRLADFMDARRHRPFEWGVQDCCLFPADAVEAMTGFDGAAWARGNYEDHRGALRLVNQFGGISGLVATSLPYLEPVHALRAQRGDLVSLEQESFGARLGVRWLSGVVAPGPDGLILLNLPESAQCWHVPF